MYHYIRSEPGLWTVGTGEGKNWQPESDHESPEAAAKRVAWLNGSPVEEIETLRLEIAELRARLEEIESEQEPNDMYEDHQRMKRMMAGMS